jgi:hypothetical protein
MRGHESTVRHGIPLSTRNTTNFRLDNQRLQGVHGTRISRTLLPFSQWFD